MPAANGDTPDPGGKWLYRVGGVSAIALGIAYIVIIALYVPAGAPPQGTEARLAYHAKGMTVWVAILTLSVLTDFLFVPVAFALYFALKEVHRNAMLLATAFTALFIVLDLALTWTNYAVLITLSNNYAAAANDAERAIAVAAAMYPTAVLESSLLFFCNTLVLAAGIFITGWVMLAGIFNKTTAWLGIATGILGMVSVVASLFTAGLSIMIIFASILTTAWVTLAGFGLYRLGRE